MKNKLLIALVFLGLTQLTAQTFDVINYNINLNVPNTNNHYIDGYTVLEINSLEDDLSDINLMLQFLSVDSVKVLGVNQSYTHVDRDLNITLENPLQTDETSEIFIYYQGNAVTDADGWGGYYSISGYVFNMGVSMSSDPHNYGRAWYPCVDNFTDKATYNYNITCEDSKTAVCGGTLQSEIDNGDGTKTYAWFLDKNIPTYLSSMAVGEYDVYRDTLDALLGEVPVSIYARSSEIDNVESSFTHLDEIVNIFEDRFGAYRWSRIGYVGVPFNSGAMEHAENIAYPNSSINGNLDSETLYAHELAHSWFGNLTTCSTAGDMWINEGWASYCEAIFTEGLYGTDAFKTYNRNRHKNNIQNLHFNEGGFLALYDMPTDLTYGSHIYLKGADVAHSLRGHLGDDVFFSSMTAFLDTYAFQSVSSYEFRDFLTANTPYDLEGFFDAWVFDGGWLHFSVDSFEVTPNAAMQFEVEVFMRQKLKGKTEYGQNLRIPIQFLNENFERIDTVITMSGETDSQSFILPFHPSTVLCDMEEQLSDGTTDIYEMYKETGTYTYYKSLFKTEVSGINDSVLFRVEHNWAAPDDFINPVEGLQIHPDRYWKVSGIVNDDFEANGQFYFSKLSSEHIDNDFIVSHPDSLVVLYRPMAGNEWQIIPHTRVGFSSTIGYLVIDQIQLGEYALALKDNYVGISDLRNEEHIKVYPNPAQHNLTIEYSSIPEGVKDLSIYNLSGQLLKQQSLNTNQEKAEVNISNLTAGRYLIKLGNISKEFVVE